MSKRFDQLRELTLSGPVSATAYMVGYDLASGSADKEFRLALGPLMEKLTPQFGVGTVSTGAAGSQATVSLTKDGDGVWKFDLTLPRGANGADGTGGGGGGTAVSFVNGNVTKLAAGSQPTANIRKIDDVTYAIDLGLPPGMDGAPGQPGLQGAPGTPGVRGDTGLTGPKGDTPTIQAGNVTTLANGQPPTIALRALGGDAYALDLGIPAGATGATGTAGTNGTNGTNGQGVPTGGTTGQLLAKDSSTNYDTKWIDPPTGGGSSMQPVGKTVRMAEEMVFTDSIPATTKTQVTPWLTAFYTFSGSSIQAVSGPKPGFGFKRLQPVAGQQNQSNVVSLWHDVPTVYFTPGQDTRAVCIVNTVPTDGSPFYFGFGDSNRWDQTRYSNDFNVIKYESTGANMQVMAYSNSLGAGFQRNAVPMGTQGTNRVWEIFYDGTARTISFYIDGVLLGTSSTAVAQAFENMQLYFGIQMAGTGTAPTAIVDFLGLEMTPSRLMKP